MQPVSYYGEYACGDCPSGAAGTTNYWSHLWTYHRRTWYELKKRDGKLNDAGEEQLASLQAALGSGEATETHTKAWGEFLSAKLPAAAQLRTLSTVWCPNGLWIPI